MFLPARFGRSPIRLKEVLRKGDWRKREASVESRLTDDMEEVVDQSQLRSNIVLLIIARRSLFSALSEGPGNVFPGRISN